MKLPEKMKAIYDKSSFDKQRLFDMAIQRFVTLGLDLYGTDSPDVRAKHLNSGVVFLSIWLKVRKGIEIQIRFDGCGQSVLHSKPASIVHYDKDSRARWASYLIQSNRDLESALQTAHNVLQCDPPWGHVG